MKKNQRVKKLLLATALLCCFTMGTASAGVGFGIAIPVGGAMEAANAPEDGYAAFATDDLAVEILAREKSGKLHLEMRLTNRSAHDMVFSHKDGQMYDFTLTDRKGREVWRWSDGMSFTQALTTSSIPAGEAVVYSADIERKAYRKFKEDAVFVNMYVKDSPYGFSLKLSRAAADKCAAPVIVYGGVGTGGAWW